jgi:hypothetical protein
MDVCDDDEIEVEMLMRIEVMLVDRVTRARGSYSGFRGLHLIGSIFIITGCKVGY